MNVKVVILVPLSQNTASQAAPFLKRSVYRKMQIIGAEIVFVRKACLNNNQNENASSFMD